METEYSGGCQGQGKREKWGDIRQRIQSFMEIDIYTLLILCVK